MTKFIFYLVMSLVAGLSVPINVTTYLITSGAFFCLFIKYDPYSKTN